MSNLTPQTTAGTGSRWALGAAVLLIVVALLALGVYTWTSLGPVEMSTNGYIALVLGAIGTVALGVGLMVLLFYSNRRGYDDAAAGKRKED